MANRSHTNQGHRGMNALSKSGKAHSSAKDIESAKTDLPSTKYEIGSIEGTLFDLGTHCGHPAVRVIEARTGTAIWCRLSADLQSKFGEKATFSDVWRHQRVIVRGRLRYDEKDRTLSYVLAADIDKINPIAGSVDDLYDADFTGGMSTVEYLDKFREGAFG